jgi:hypothetical protein
MPYAAPFHSLEIEDVEIVRFLALEKVAYMAPSSPSLVIVCWKMLENRIASQHRAPVESTGREAGEKSVCDRAPVEGGDEGTDRRHRLVMIHGHRIEHEAHRLGVDEVRRRSGLVG